MPTHSTDTYSDSEGRGRVRGRAGGGDGRAPKRARVTAPLWADGGGSDGELEGEGEGGGDGDGRSEGGRGEGVDPAVAGENPYQACEQKCRVSCRERDQWDIRPHVSGEGEEESTTPCPLMFRDGPLVFMEADFRPADPLGLGERVMDYMVQNPDALKVWSLLEQDYETTAGRDVIQEFFRLSTVRMLADEAAGGMMQEDLAMEDEQPVEEYLKMLRYMQKPFEDLEVPDEYKHTMVTLFNNYLRFKSPYAANDIQVLERVEVAFDNLNSVRRFSDDVVGRVKGAFMRMKNQRLQVMAARKTMYDPCPNAFSREDPDHPRHVALTNVRSVLAAKDVVVSNNDSDERPLFSLPILSGSGCPTYTYSDEMPMHLLLSKIEADPVICEAYVQHKRYINGVFATNHSRSEVPYIPHTFVNSMRYVSWTNGVLCARTGIFYYHRGSLPEGMPDNWAHFSDSLTRVNRGQIRALKFIAKPCRYYETVVCMLRGAFLRLKEPGVAEFYRDHEETCVDHTHGGDTRMESRANEQDAWVRRRLGAFDEWIHHAQNLAHMEPLDVRLMSTQKMLQDQQIPRNTYRSWLEMAGRSLSGVIGEATRPTSGAQRLMEEFLGHPVDDRLEYATVLEGTAGSGKSTLLSQIEYYFEEHLIGRVADQRRAIDYLSVVRHKAFIEATDMHKEEVTPIPQGDLKKMISNEHMVNHILHRPSCVVQFLQHVIFAMNGPLPYSDVNGDMERRFAQIKWQRRISEQNMHFSETDRRTINQVWEEEDSAVFAVVAVFAHKRHLLNVGMRPYYRPGDKRFPVPKYLLGTQAEYCRNENSFRAFILGMERQSQVSFDPQYAQHSVPRDIVHNDYVSYCDENKCKVMDATARDKYMRSTFGVRVSGNPMCYFGMKYRDQSTGQGAAGVAALAAPPAVGPAGGGDDGDGGDFNFD